MNVMAQAHKLAREFRANATGSFAEMSYARVFKQMLRNAHKEYKAMNKQAQELKAQTIAQFEARVIELKAILNGPDAQKYIVVVGDDHPLPVNFDSVQLWANVETATKWNSRQFAESNARKVVNGHNQVGKAIRIDQHIEWDIANLQKLINNLKA